MKMLEFDGIGVVKVYKRRGQKSIKLSITRENSVRVSIPFWVPYAHGLKYAQKNIEWINKHIKATSKIRDGVVIGNIFSLNLIVQSDSVKFGSSIKGADLTIRVPAPFEIEDENTQAKIRQICIKHMRQYAHVLLSERLKLMASKSGFTYQDVKVRQLRGRWGSCSRDKVITLNIYLIQLSKEQIDYVLMHELLHTKILSHGPIFWNELGTLVPNLNAVRKQMKTLTPSLKITPQ
jgi:predicted metal-dependent hydrolase